MHFFIALEAEIVKAEIAGRSIIIEIDANSKLGTKYIPNDPHSMSANGKILSDIIERHVLIVANGTRKCTGKITRQRNTTRQTEKSCIDLLIFSTDLESNFESLVVDEARTHVLTRIVNTKKGVMKKESDHNVLIAKFNCIIEGLENKKKHEVYNLKNIECQKKFYEYTSNKRMLSSVFDAQEDLNLLTHRFIKKLDGCIKMCFKKVRLSNT